MTYIKMNTPFDLKRFKLKGDQSNLLVVIRSLGKPIFQERTCARCKHAVYGVVSEPISAID